MGITVVSLIACAVIFRILGNNGIYPITLGLSRTFIYIGLYIRWGISVSKRIVQAQVRRNLIAVVLLNVFWLEDISDISALLKELEENKETLQKVIFLSRKTIA